MLLSSHSIRMLRSHDSASFRPNPLDLHTQCSHPTFSPRGALPDRASHQASHILHAAFSLDLPPTSPKPIDWSRSHLFIYASYHRCIGHSAPEIWNPGTGRRPHPAVPSYLPRCYQCAGFHKCHEEHAQYSASHHIMPWSRSGATVPSRCRRLCSHKPSNCHRKSTTPSSREALTQPHAPSGASLPPSHARLRMHAVRRATVETDHKAQYHHGLLGFPRSPAWTRSSQDP